MSHLIQDFRYGLRQVGRAPGFFAIAACLIAVGIAATTQMFTLVDALLLRPLPVRDPQSLVQVFEQQAKRPADALFDYGFYKQLVQYSATLVDIAGQVETTRAMETNGHGERVHTTAVTEEFFGDLGVTPLLGRALGKGDTHVAMLSYACWSGSFGRDPKVLGRVVRLQGHAYTIVGVTAQAFNGTMVDSSPDLWIPFANQVDFARTPNSDLNQYVVEIVARLRPGVTEGQAQSETAALWKRYLQARVDSSGLKRGRLEVRSIAHGVSAIREQSKTALWPLLAGTGLLLLMVCANVGGLQLSRATARERETAVRFALGASRGRIMRQWLVESLLLTAAGGCGGLLLAWASLPVMMRWMPPAHGNGFDPSELRTSMLHPALDFRVAAFALAVCGLTALLCALAPAWRSMRSDISQALKSAISDKKNRLFQATLCGVQIALCTTLLLSAGLVIRSLSNLLAADAGFEREHITVFSIDPHVRGYDAQRTWKVEQRLLTEAKELPGVESAALAYRALMRGIGLGTSVVFPGQRGGVINSSINSVSPEYFGVMGIRFLAGRNFAPSDIAAEDKLTKVIVNEAFVRKFLGGRSALGEKFGTGQQFVKPQYEVIGVVGDTKYRSLREVPPPIYYYDGFGPAAYPDSFILQVRSRGDPHAVVEPVRQIVHSIDPELPLYQAATLSEEVEQSLWQERLLVTLSSCFGAFALALSVLGLYGVLAYFVTRRQREIGLRMALGADSMDVAWLVIRRVIPMVAAGISAGVALSWLASPWVRSLLYGVEPFDVTTNITTMLLLAAAGIGGAAVPALRAMRVDPATSLRRD